MMSCDKPNLIQTYNLTCGENKEIVLEPAGMVEKEVAHQNDLLHKSVHLLIFYENQVLCRYRIKTEARYPGVYTTTIGTHVLNNDNYLDTLKRFLPHKSFELKYAGEFLVHDEFENEINGLYVARLDGSLPNGFLTERQFFSKHELRNMIINNKTTPHLAEAFKLIDKDF